VPRKKTILPLSNLKSDLLLWRELCGVTSKAATIDVDVVEFGTSADEPKP
jgi:hypothetical protein